MPKISGPFDVKLASLDVYAKDALGRRSIDKVYHGDLDATGQGEMLAAMASAGSGVYVAIEKVTGTLGGKSGSFLLHHTGLMDHGTQNLSVKVVPESGAGELVGLTGSMNIVIAEGGKHSYEFEYDLP